MDAIKAFVPFLVLAAVGYAVGLVLVILHWQGWAALFLKPLLPAVVLGGGSLGLWKLLPLIAPGLAKALDEEPAAPVETPAPKKGSTIDLRAGDEPEPSRSGLFDAPPSGGALPSFDLPPSSPSPGFSAPSAPSAPPSLSNNDPSKRFPQDNSVLAKAVRHQMSQE